MPQSFSLKEEFARRKQTIFELGVGEVAKSLGFNAILFLIYMNPELGQRKSDSKGYTREFWEQKFSILDTMAQNPRKRLA